MIRYYDKNGKSTGWLQTKPSRKELERLTIDQLLVIANKRKNFKKVLVDFLEGIELKL